ncbi:Sir2 histone deacetylase Hst2 [Coniochaeta pulveracea]|uniref:Sir2 histone deacetylase Hst2 n=1 Tax=Coniochaeta pulveracea TaxID=177199 RepID=A0A420YC78_9PEZI|nr:Sir2 histone deacetylase Hst2 [Coniochaeta pulveracea]
MGQDNSVVSDDTAPVTLRERSLDAVADHIQAGGAKNVLVMTGAGISTAAGIPDFRSKDTGLYANLARLNLPYAEAVFDIGYFRDHPEPFYILAQELYPGKFYPTISHVFIALLAAKGLLFHLFTQNIDTLERRAGVPGDKIVEAHGSFATQRCIDCKTPYPDDKMHEHVLAGNVPRCEECNGLVKPDIVFFGEALPDEFREKAHYAAAADLVLIMGTSLSVHPFAGLPGMIREGVPRVLFNMERVGGLGARSDDVLELGDCDAGIRKLADKLGWRDELESKWRELVGEEEAERQLKGAKVREVALEDEVDKLADEVEDALKIRDGADQADSDAGNAAQTGQTPEVKDAAREDTTRDSEPEPVNPIESIPGNSAPVPPPPGIKEPPASPTDESDRQLAGEDTTQTGNLHKVVSNTSEAADDTWVSGLLARKNS